MALTLSSQHAASPELRAAVSFFGVGVEVRDADGDAEPQLVRGDDTKSGVAEVAAALFSEEQLVPAEFAKWVSRAPKQLLPQLNKALESRTFLAAPTAAAPSVADVMLFVRAAPLVGAQKAPERSELNHATRWWAHMQHVLAGHTAVAPVDVDLKYKPPKKKADEGEKGGKGGKGGKEGGKGGKGGKEGGKGGKGGGDGGRRGKAEAAGKAVESDATKCLMLVGRILSIKKHPEADRLFVEEVDLGQDAPRTIISGLVAHYSAEQLANRLVVVAANLKPATMVGIESRGMVLCACNGDKSKVEVLDPPEGAVPGERVSFDGYEGAPADVCAGKVLSRLLKSMKTNGDRVATFKGVPMMTTAGPVTVPSLASSAIG